MTTAQKVETCKKSARKLWPKYDPDLNTKIDGRVLINKYITNIFEDAKLKSEFVQLKKEKPVDGLIDKQVSKAAKN